MRQRLDVALGGIMIVAGLFSASLTLARLSVDADERERSQSHEQTHTMMDVMNMMDGMTDGGIMDGGDTMTRREGER